MRIYLTIILLFLLQIVYSQDLLNYPGIPTNTNFNPLTSQPLDGRDTITVLADTSVLTPFAYKGQITYAYDTDNRWEYNGSYWQIYGEGDGYFGLDVGAGNVTYDLAGDLNYDFSGQGNFDIDSIAYFFVTPRANQGGNDSYIYLGRPGGNNVNLQIYGDGASSGFSSFGNINNFLVVQPTTARIDIATTSTGFEILDGRATPRGLEYNASYTSGFSGLSLVHKDYVDSLTSGGGYNIYTSDDTLSGNRIVEGNSNSLLFTGLSSVTINADSTLLPSLTISSLDTLLGISNTGRLYKAAISDISISDYSLSLVDQYLTSNRLISGSNTYDLTIDSIPELHINPTEIFITDGLTTVANIIGTSSKYDKENSGYARINSLGLDFMYFQNTNGVDEFHRLTTSEDDISIQSKRKEVVGTASYGSAIHLDPDFSYWRMGDSLISTLTQIYINRDYISIEPADSLLIELDGVFDESLTTVMAIDTSTNRVQLKTISGGTVAYETFTSGSVTTNVSRFGGTNTIVTNPSTGVYTYTVAANSHILEIDFLGNDANLNSGVITLNIDNSANSRDRYFTVQVLQRTTNGQIDEEATATVYTQSSSANTTTIQISNLGGFGTAGYRLMLR